MLQNAGKYNKTIVVALGSLATSLQAYYGNAHWIPLVISGITVVSVFLVPNVSVSNVPANEPQKVSQ